MMLQFNNITCQYISKKLNTNQIIRGSKFRSNNVIFSIRSDPDLINFLSLQFYRSRSLSYSAIG